MQLHGRTYLNAHSLGAIQMWAGCGLHCKCRMQICKPTLMQKLLPVKLKPSFCFINPSLNLFFVHVQLLPVCRVQLFAFVFACLHFAYAIVCVCAFICTAFVHWYLCVCVCAYSICKSLHAYLHVCPAFISLYMCIILNMCVCVCGTACI